jgi:hypothetical protein
MPSYSFADVEAVIDGPGGNFSIKDGTANEGIDIAPVGDRSTMTPGADGSVMHSLSASSASAVTVRLLKTSPVNAQLMQLFNHQVASSARHGQNVITVRDAARGDLVTVSQAAFKRPPAIKYAVDGGIQEWVFDGGWTTYVLGSGSPEAE